jgi:hypothetical protein
MNGRTLSPPALPPPGSARSERDTYGQPCRMMAGIGDSGADFKLTVENIEHKRFRNTSWAALTFTSWLLFWLLFCSVSGLPYMSGYTLGLWGSLYDGVRRRCAVPTPPANHPRRRTDHAHGSPPPPLRSTRLSSLRLLVSNGRFWT